MPISYDEVSKALQQLLNQVMQDENLDEEDKSQAVDLINDVVANPTPNNLEALALVVEELGKSQEYLAALDIVDKYRSEQAPVDATPAE